MKTTVQPQMLQTGRPAFGLALLATNWFTSFKPATVTAANFASVVRRHSTHAMVRSGSICSTGGTGIKRNISNRMLSRIVRGQMPQVAGG